MVANIRKYKTVIFAGLFAAYLAGTFQDIFLESLHHISHIAEELSIELRHSYYNHAHEDGNVHTHRHVVLKEIERSLDAADEKQAPVNEQQKSQKKKNPEWRFLYQQGMDTPTLTRQKPSGTSFAILRLFPRIPTPPPKANYPV